MAYEFQLNRRLFDRLCAEAGLTTQAAIADRLGIHVVTLNRVLNGHGTPGPDFIGRLRTTFPEYPLDDLVSITIKRAPRNKEAV